VALLDSIRVEISMTERNPANPQSSEGRAALDAVSAKHQAAVEALRQSEERFRVALRNSHITVFNQDRDLRYTWIYNSQPKSAAADVLGRTDADLWPPDEAVRLEEIKRRVMQSGSGEFQEARLTTGGETYFYDLTVEPLRNADGAVIGVTCAASDVTERKRMEESLHAMTMVDDLTGVYNRRGFMTLAEQQLKLARRSKSPVILLYVDVDNLKRVNDSLGHPEGDILLSRTAIVLRRSFREADVLARIGGDEFAVLAMDATRKSIETPLRRLRINLDEDNAHVDDAHRLVLTTGLACYDPADPRPLEKLLSEADGDMYECKRQKRTAPRA
jgi:diguanylate cyclase (GGDEF)-like protein/PAS domain S-box-containing protein